MYHLSQFHKRLATSTGLSLGVLGLFLLPFWLFAIIALGIPTYIISKEWPLFYSPDDKKFWLIMPFYPIGPILLLLYLQWSGYEILNLMTITLVGAHDSGSYFIGKQWGQSLIDKELSPGKTWEGFIGGTILSFLFSFIFFGQNPWAIIFGSVLPFVISLCFASLSGDLFESSLKRSKGLKDSGTLLPGHGGLLDRIDGLLFGIVLVFLVRNWLVMLL